jgi:hypothetical protein
MATGVRSAAADSRRVAIPAATRGMGGRSCFLLGGVFRKVKGVFGLFLGNFIFCSCLLPSFTLGFIFCPLFLGTL